MKYRYENFGGIIAGDDPPFLAFVDRAYMRQLGLQKSPLWNEPDAAVGILKAPLEVHMALTNRCSAGCPHCYMNAGAGDAGELDTAAFKSALQILADLEVFHVALGGGEALERPDLFEIAAYARRIGLVPNLTISGRHFTPAVAGQMTVFGQVNVSMDGVGSNSAVFRGRDMFPAADRALRLLVASGVPAGINCVLGRRNYDGLAGLFRYAARRGANEIEFLRFKPAGRALASYLKEATTPAQNRTLIPYLAELGDRFGVTAKIDCSFVPMLCYHRPPVEALTQLATYGCEAGNVLLGIRSNGSVAGCSFLESDGLSVFDLTPAARAKAFNGLFTWVERAPLPCRDCDYLQLCKGGCRAVSWAVCGSLDAPDPGCPFVVEQKSSAGGTRMPSVKERD